MKNLILLNIWLGIAMATIAAMSYFESQGSFGMTTASAVLGTNLFVVYLFKVLLYT